MMWLVRLALRRPLSVAVMALLMLVLGALSFAYMNIDIFPAINLPVVMMVWNYPGLSPYDMERRMVTISERALSTTVNAIEHLESESIQGIGIVKIYFQPGADLGRLDGADQCSVRNDPSSDAAGNRTAADHLLQRLKRTGSSTQRVSAMFFQGSNYTITGSISSVSRLFTIPGFSSPQPLGGVQRNRDGEPRSGGSVRQPVVAPGHR